MMRNMSSMNNMSNMNNMTASTRTPNSNMSNMSMMMPMPMMMNESMFVSAMTKLYNDLGPIIANLQMSSDMMGNNSMMSSI